MYASNYNYRLRNHAGVRNQSYPRRKLLKYGQKGEL